MKSSNILLSRGGGSLHRFTLTAAKYSSSAFSLVEVLVASVIVAVASLAAISAFNVVIQSIGGTGIRADQSRRIDAQIAAISELAEVYTSCSTPLGEIPANPQAICGGTIQARSSFYYFPDPSESADVEAFFGACRSDIASTHITNNFILAINALPSPGGDVSAPVAVRVPPIVAANHLVRITWSSDPGGQILRGIQLSPLLSAWCP